MNLNETNEPNILEDIKALSNSIKNEIADKDITIDAQKAQLIEVRDLLKSLVSK